MNLEGFLRSKLLIKLLVEESVIELYKWSKEDNELVLVLNVLLLSTPIAH